MPEQAELAKAHIKIASVYFRDQTSTDIGARCFISRTPVRGAAKISVDPSSYRLSREEVLCRMIDSLCNIEPEELSQRSLCENLAQTMRWIDWADSTLDYDCLGSENAARRGLAEYDLHHANLVRSAKIKNNSAIKKIDSIVWTLSNLFQVDMKSELPRRHTRREKIKSVIPPTIDEKEIALSLYSSIFNGLFDAIKAEKSFPFGIEVPARFHRKDNIAYIFPTRKFFSLDEKGYLTCEFGSLVWNFVTGTIDSPKLTGRKVVDKALIGTKNRLAEIMVQANGPGANIYRVFLAKLAMRAAIQYFILNTGMNLTQVIALQWDDDFVEYSIAQGFRAYKSRANGAEVEFVIEAKFKPVFLKIIELRKYLLQGRKSNILFFSANAVVKGNFVRNSSAELQKDLIFFEKIDPLYDRIGSKKARKAKAVHFLSEYGAEVAADAMQNTSSVILRNYSDTDVETVEREFTSFYKSIPIRIANRDAHLDLTATGGCGNPGNPSQPLQIGELKANCEQELGCLFCVQYLAHADSLDIWKLLSAKFVIVERATVHVNQQEFDEKLKNIIDRIDEILARIIEKNGQLASVFEGLKSRVFVDGDLEPFWAKKMEIFYLLG